jgi:hypothetical protein
MKSFGIVGIVIVLAVALLNALFMLISPAKWFDLPEWISLRGYFNRRMHDHGWGAVQVRLVGLGISLLIVYMLWSAARFSPK